MDEVAEKTGHDIDALDAGLNRFFDLLDDLNNQREGLKELFVIWRQPWFTTPAEFYLIKAVLEGLVAQTREVQRSTQALAEGSRAVAPKQ